MSHFGVPHTVNHAASGALRRNGKAAMSRIDRSKSRSAGGKGFYIALALCLAAVGAIGYFTLIRPANVHRTLFISDIKFSPHFTSVYNALSIVEFATLLKM